MRVENGMGLFLRGLIAAVLLFVSTGAGAQEAASPPVPAAAPNDAAAASATAPSGGTIRGVVKSGAVPLPGVAVTATNTLTGKKYSTSTDVTGAYAMAIPRNGRYVVRAELAAFASETLEALINAAGENGGKPEQTADFTLQLASRVQQAGEPFQLFFTPAEIAAELAAFRGIEDLGSPEMNARYFAGRRDSLKLRGAAGRLLCAWLLGDSD